MTPISAGLVTYRYATIRVVPRSDREEFLNVGVLLETLHPEKRTTAVITERWRLAAQLDPGCDLDVLRRQLEALRQLAAGEPEAGPMAELPPRERFHFLSAPRSGIVRTSDVHVGQTVDVERTLRELTERYCADAEKSS